MIAYCVLIINGAVNRSFNNPTTSHRLGPRITYGGECERRIQPRTSGVIQELEYLSNIIQKQLCPGFGDIIYVSFLYVVLHKIHKLL